MRKTERYRALVEYFTEHFPEPETELRYGSPYELLVAVILSAQCTDKRVNLVTPPLFERFPTAASLARSTPEEVYGYIRSVSYPNNKARHLVGMAQLLTERFGGEVPAAVADLQLLPGVGRKTANVVVSVIYNQPAMAVDTHVFRVSHRLGLVARTAKTPLAVELELTKHLPNDLIARAHHWLILHGRYICLARRPLCEKCPLTDFCLYFEKNGLPKPAKKA